jgi:hypothetical protein
VDTIIAWVNENPAAALWIFSFIVGFLPSHVSIKNPFLRGLARAAQFLAANVKEALRKKAGSRASDPDAPGGAGGAGVGRAFRFVAF